MSADGEREAERQDQAHDVQERNLQGTERALEVTDSVSVELVGEADERSPRPAARAPV